MDYKKELEELIEKVISEGTSDLHLAEGRHPTIRSYGLLIPLVKKPVFSNADAYGFIDELLPFEEKERFIEKKEIDFAYNYKDRARFRGNAFFQQGKISISLRYIPSQIKNLEELNLPPVLSDFARKEQGFFLVVGPVGHGKTTTLAAMVDIINTERLDHIITIEDPIEYVFSPKKSIIDQRQIREDTPDFPTALNGVFRQDVDTVMIGEMRETETIATAVTASETGHLVLSTLHTNSASQTLDRIVDSFPSDQQNQIKLQLAGSLLGIFSQRLVPRISGGMVPAYELLINNNATMNLIREGRTHEINTVIETSSNEGMVDFNRSLADLVRGGEITLENALRFSPNPKVIEKII